ncbi:MAG TPA: glycoside hydrolase 43 family protein [Lacunisphaera sp.]|nr:glycoside hydrolase 43 family protein [Lacunisphaera sp.]
MWRRFEPARWLRLAAVCGALAGAASAEPVLPWGDQGDGTYRNPILPADYSDPDVIRVGDDFYLVASEFHFMGIQVLHSRDLVNWRVIGRVFDRLDLDPKYDEVRAYAQGTWAPSLRYHDGVFHLYVCTPRDGLLHYTARHPAGPWTGAVVKRVEQWEDPCPFWDDDGSAWLVHGRLGAGPLYLHRMSADGSQLLDEGVEIYRGPVAEGPKLFKRHGWYYISLPEGGVERGGQSILRARALRGPYERRVVLPDGSPHQGGLVELEHGAAWFIGFKSAGHLGRVPCLEPVQWGGDDWPVFGDHGRPVAGGRKPALGAGGPIEHPQTSDDFDASELQPQWQWNHNPAPAAWSLAARPGWLRLQGRPAPDLASARNTLTQKLWGGAGSFEVKLEVGGLAEGQQAGVAFMSGKVFNFAGVMREGGVNRIVSDAGSGPELDGSVVWLRGEYRGDAARLGFSVDGTNFAAIGGEIRLQFSRWKGARMALYSYGGEGAADFDYFHFQHGTAAVPLNLPDATPIDREALVSRHNVTIRRVDPEAPLTVGNGGFAFTVDVTGLQTFGDHYYLDGIPLETLARWCWTTEDNPQGFKLADTNESYPQADGTSVALPSKLGTAASDWLRRNPQLHPLGQISLEWSDGTPLKPEDIQAPEQTLDLWRGIITSKYQLAGEPVTVTTACDPAADTIAVRIESELVRSGRLRVRVAFPRGHDPAIKNTPPLDWSQPATHTSRLVAPGLVERSVGGTTYWFATDRPLQPAAAHAFTLGGRGGATLAFTAAFSPDRPAAPPAAADGVFTRSAAHWADFWRGGAAVDFAGSSNPLAPKIEERIVLSRYLTAVQCAADVPPQESGLTCNTWYGKHHTEMIWWSTAHFILWGETDLAKRNLEWFVRHLPEARALAVERGLRGARWAKMVGPDDRESPGGNPLIAWNQPHVIYLCDLLLRQSPSQENLEHYRDVVFETAECMAAMLKLDAKRDRYVLGPPLWIAQEIHDPATSQNPAFELAYWRWGLETAQRWRLRSGLPRQPEWDAKLAKLSPLPVVDGKYTALESHPDTWTDLASRHDHPEMLMALGFLPGGPDVDRATMDRTLTGVLQQWDWATKIWGWDYPMVAMTATRLGRPADAVDVLMRDGPNNHYLPNGHAPVGSDRAHNQGGRREIAVYLPANGSFLSAVALMVGGWEGCSGEFPGFPKDGTWHIRAEGLTRLP